MSCYALHGQQDTVALKEVAISTTALTVVTSGLRQQMFDSLTLETFADGDMADMLHQRNAMYIKEYGSGGLSATALRGGSAYHTATVWNGIPVSNPLNGIADMSLISPLLFDGIGIVYGGSSTLWGSGAVSGAIHLKNHPSFESGLHVTSGIFGDSRFNRNEYVKAGFGGRKYSGSVSLLNSDNENRYYFKTGVGSKRITQAASQKQEALFENHFRADSFTTMSVNAWFTQSERLVPPSEFQIDAGAFQKDSYYRVTGEVSRVKKRYEIAARTAFLRERINYDDNFLSYPSENASSTMIGEATKALKLKNHFFQAGLNNTLTVVDSSVNLPQKNQNRFSVFALHTFRPANGKLEITTGARKEFSPVSNSPFVVSGGVNFHTAPHTTFRLAASQVYRNPTLNDLYWQPGGNPELQPEKGFSAEAGMRIEPLRFFPKSSRTTFIVNATAYYKRINNWIAWFPSPETFVWSPSNLMQVVSRGFELSGNCYIKGNSYSLALTADYCYTNSTNEKSKLVNDASLGKQLIYVPVNSGRAGIMFSRLKWDFSFNHSYNGHRYTSTDNSAFLTPYSSGAVRIAKSIQANDVLIKISFVVDNLYNTDYESVQGRPMPLRSYGAGIKLSYIKPNQP